MPCGSSYVSSCKFIADAHNASVEIPVLEKTIIEKIEEAKDYKEKIVTVDSAAMVALIDSYNETIIAKNGIEIEKRDNKVSIEKLFAKSRQSQANLKRQIIRSLYMRIIRKQSKTLKILFLPEKKPGKR